MTDHPYAFPAIFRKTRYELRRLTAETINRKIPKAGESTLIFVRWSSVWITPVTISQHEKATNRKVKKEAVTAASFLLLEMTLFSDRGSVISDFWVGLRSVPID
tara:strand:+ start:1894 stop:2205 length:312 start_codon:yes stop_codon:yes gene_type:complete